MELLKIFYWGVSYTTGIACLTAFLLRFILKRDLMALRLSWFLASFGLSIVSLSLMEANAVKPRISGIAGVLALCGAALIIITFPHYAIGFKKTKRRHRIAVCLKIEGATLFVLTFLSLFIRIPYFDVINSITLISLVAAISIGMTWLNQGSLDWEIKRGKLWMASIFALFGLVVIFDFFRNFFPPLRSWDRGYYFLPGFYMYLNIFLFFSHIADYMPASAKTEGTGAAVSLLERYAISKREAEVLALLAQGRTYAEIADSLFISLATVKSHISHLYEKTETRNKVELINLLYDSSPSPQIQPKSR